MAYKEQLLEWTQAVTKLTKDVQIVRQLAKPAPKVYQLPNPQELKKNQIQAFSSPSSHNFMDSNHKSKLPTTPFSPTNTFAPLVPPAPTTPAQDTIFYSSPHQAGFFSPGGGRKSALDISPHPANVSWSTSKIYNASTPSKFGLNQSFQPSPMTATTESKEKEAGKEVITLTEAEENSCNEL